VNKPTEVEDVKLLDTAGFVEDANGQGPESGLNGNTDTTGRGGFVREIDSATSVFIHLDKDMSHKDLEDGLPFCPRMEEAGSSSAVHEEG
jgi:hypothetical protein